MYLPEHFKEPDNQEVERLIEAFPLACIVAQGEAGLIANHVPLIADGKSRLIGHIALQNDLHRSLEDRSNQVLVIFRGEDAYISPNWYPSKQEHHRHVPTWNYQIAHIDGLVRFSHDEKNKRAVVGKMTKFFETKTNGRNAWKMADAPRDYMEQMIEGIVALEIDILKVTAKSKLSQNRDVKDFRSVQDKMRENSAYILADQMERFVPER